MALTVNTDGFRDSHYFARSWALITRDSNWPGTIIMLWLALLVPIAGPLGVMGYIVERARAAAWEVPANPRQGGGLRVGACIRSGWRAAIVSVVWLIVLTFIAVAVVLVPGIGHMIAVLIIAALGLLVRIAVLRATIYQSFAGGFRPGVVFQMADRDTVGLVRIFCIQLIGGAAVYAIWSTLFSIAVRPSLSVLVSAIMGLSNSSLSTSDLISHAAEVLALLFARLVPGLFMACFIAALFAIVLSMVVNTALALWIRQFNVPAWGGNDDPLPIAQSDPSYGPYGPQEAASANPSQQDGIPRQIPYAYGDTDYGQATHGSVGQSFAGSQQEPADPNGPVTPR